MLIVSYGFFVFNEKVRRKTQQRNKIINKYFDFVKIVVLKEKKVLMPMRIIIIIDKCVRPSRKVQTVWH